MEPISHQIQSRDWCPLLMILTYLGSLKALNFMCLFGPWNVATAGYPHFRSGQFDLGMWIGKSLRNVTASLFWVIVRLPTPSSPLPPLRKNKNRSQRKGHGTVLLFHQSTHAFLSDDRPASFGSPSMVKLKTSSHIRNEILCQIPSGSSPLRTLAPIT